MSVAQSETRRTAPAVDKQKLLADFAAIKTTLGEMFPSVAEDRLNQAVAGGCAEKVAGTVRERYLASLHRVREIIMGCKLPKN